jgi:hypothetical protein
VNASRPIARADRSYASGLIEVAARERLQRAHCATVTQKQVAAVFAESSEDFPLGIKSVKAARSSGWTKSRPCSGNHGYTQNDPTFCFIGSPYSTFATLVDVT